MRGGAFGMCETRGYKSSYCLKWEEQLNGCVLHLGVILSPVAGYYCYVVAPEVEAVGTKTHGFHATSTRENKL